MTLQIECAGILFDLDGVLIDSTSCITRRWAEWARQHELDLAVVMAAAHGTRTIETMCRVSPHLDLEAEAARFTALEVADTDGVVPLDGALALLTGLPPTAWTIVTSGDQALARARLRRAGLPIPALLVGGDDVRQGKPAPEPYLLGAQRLGLTPDQCVVIEDAPAGIAAAHAAGMRVIAITTTHARHELDSSVAVDRLSALHITPDANNRLLIQVEAKNNG